MSKDLYIEQFEGLRYPAVSVWNYLTYYDEHFDLFKTIDDIADYASGIELWPSGDEYKNQNNWAKIAKKIRMFKNISVHGLFNSSQQETAFTQLDFCESVGARVFVVHPNMLGFESEDETLPAWRESLDFSKRLIDYGHIKGVDIAVENILSFSMIEKLIKSIPEIKICIDTGHANLDRKHSVADYLRTFKERLVHIHIHDNRGHEGLSIKPGRLDMDDYDQHLPLGEGTIDWNEFLESSGRNQLQRFSLFGDSEQRTL